MLSEVKHLCYFLQWLPDAETLRLRVGNHHPPQPPLVSATEQREDYPYGMGTKNHADRACPQRK